MKKLIIVTACATLFAATSFAQTPTQDTTKRSTQQPTQSDQLRDKSSQDHSMKGWTRLQANDVPESVRQTLSSGTQYNGWQSGTIYRNEAGDAYSVQIGADKANQRVYYFDKNGKATAKPHN